MSEQCPQCGAPLLAGSTCQTIHEELLSFESLNAVPHSIHFLHVTSFLVQHERYSDEALVWAKSMLHAHLDETMTEQQLLEQLRTAGKDRGSHVRTWKFNRAPDAPPLPKIRWSMTIVDVTRQMENDAERYGELIKQWAQATLQQMASWPL